MNRARCDYTGCNRYTRPGHTRCSNHRNAVDRKGKPAGALEKSMAGTDYGKFRPMVLQAAADADDGVDNEIAVLRAVLTKLIDEETDLGKLSAGVAKISATIITAMKAKRTLSGAAADEFSDALALIIEELNP